MLVSSGIEKAAHYFPSALQVENITIMQDLTGDVSLEKENKAAFAAKEVPASKFVCLAIQKKNK